jgi:hypothetical protein
MAFWIAKTALAVALLSATGAFALTIDEVGGPAEVPPSGFSGDQFVDSRGCVFMRAGIDGQTSWVPRIDRSRQVICDRPPTFAPPPPPPVVAETAPPPAAAAEPAATAVAAAAPAAAPPPAVRRQAPARTAAVPAGRIGCFADAPVPLRVQLAEGGGALLCTRGDGSLDGARVPLYPPGEGPAQALGAPGQIVTVMRADAAAAPAGVGAPPPGYRAAWQDGRLNPDRGPRTAEGQAQQDRILTREVPARAVAPAADGRSSFLEQAPQDRHYVQVGAFRVPGNAVRARESLRAMGLPTARAETQGLTLVFAGPFASADEAQGARSALRGAGFGDAYIR